MKQPLVIRPPYGEGKPATPLATSQMPSGGPAGRGLPLDENLPGTQTFTKPLDDHGTDDPAPEESLYRIDNPLGKRQDGGDDTIDHSNSTPSYYGLGKRDPNDYGKTHYPYRDDKPNTHNASADPHFVAQLHILSKKATYRLTYKGWTALRVAATAEQILSGLNPKFRDRASQVKVTLKRADVNNMRWIFSVVGNHTYAVKMRAIRPRKNVTKLSKMNLELSCSCPAWQWQGPEFHSTTEKYQLAKPVGTASTPDIRDPERQNRVCKHVAAVLNTVRSWDIPVRRGKK